MPSHDVETPADRPLRRDAERNRLRILEAARRLFGERGLEVTLDDIAHAAGVGVGTVYRRFPDKEQLIDALFEDRLAEFAALGEQALATDDAWEALRSFLERMLELQAEDRGLKEIALGAPHGRDRVGRARQRILPVVDELVRRAHAAGTLRPDVGPTDFPFLQMMVGAVADVTRDVDPEVWRRFLGILLDGLRPPAGDAPALPRPALGLAATTAAMQCWRAPRR